MAKGRPRTFDKEAALEKALKLFWQYGYDGTSMAMLSETLGVNAPSIYAAFGNKEKLFMQAVDRYGMLNGGMYHDSFAKETAYDVVYSILKGEVELVTRKDCPDGCLVVQSALITSPESENIRQYMSKIRGMPEQWIREQLEKAQAAGDLDKRADPAALACLIMTLNCGLAVQAKSGATRKKLLQAVDTFMAGWPYVIK